VFTIINQTVAILAASATMRPNTALQSDSLAGAIFGDGSSYHVFPFYRASLCKAAAER
jgi:hypothetical protein